MPGENLIKIARLCKRRPTRPPMVKHEGDIELSVPESS